jgi:hypothetical protein
MGHSIGDAIIVVAIAGAIFGYYYLKSRERQRRLEVIHQERLAAMDKGIPLPELPLDPLKVPKAPDPRAVLIHGIVWTALGGGAMLALRLMGSTGPWPNAHVMWPLPLPLLLLGIGLMLYYALASQRPR